jgi:transcriptional regulator with XRE-family HTH domain
VDFVIPGACAGTATTVVDRSAPGLSHRPFGGFAAGAWTPRAEARGQGRDGVRHHGEELLPESGVIVATVAGGRRAGSERAAAGDKRKGSARRDHAVVMTKRKPRALAAEAARRNLEQLASLGGAIRTARLRRRQTQQQLADAAGVSRSSLSDLERGHGGGHTMDTWQRLALAAGTPLIVKLQRDPLEATADAGHLAIQELVLRLGRRAGFTRTFELPTRTREPWRSTDVGLRDDRRRLLILCECWNTFGDIGAAARSSTRKLSEAQEYAIAVGGEAPHRVAACWIVRTTKRNRELVRRYPEVFASRFPGSSRRWVDVLTTGVEPPALPGLVWCDVDATRVFAWRAGRAAT